MRIGLIDVDSHNFPNLALMKISAWHKSRGDTVEWYEPLYSGHMDRVYMSKVFSFTPDYEYPIDADEICRGGTGYAIQTHAGMEVYDHSEDGTLPEEIEHIYPDYELYPQFGDTAYGYLTRGCPRNCGFCHTTQKDGRQSVKVANLDEFWRGQKNIVLLDQNILACKNHLELLDQLVKSKAWVEFNGGLDIRMTTPENIELLKQMKLKCIHFAFDRYQDKKIVMGKLKQFKDLTGYDKDKGRIMVYVLCNYDTTIEQDIERIQFCRSLRFSPYPMIYDKEHAAPVYKKLQRWCNNFIFWKVPTFEEYVASNQRRNGTTNDRMVSYNLERDAPWQLQLPDPCGRDSADSSDGLEAKEMISMTRTEWETYSKCIETGDMEALRAFLQALEEKQAKDDTEEDE